MNLLRAYRRARKAFRTFNNLRNLRKNRKRRKLEREGVIIPKETEMGFGIEVLKGAVRHALTAFGLVAVNAGYASEDEVQAAVGALVTLVGFGWSVYRKWARVK